MIETTEAGRPCPNCGAEGVERYCPRCGQSQRDPRRSIRVLLGELLDEFVLTARLPRTLGTLLVHPGRLTADWIDGHRARYLGPVRLYILASVVFFTVAFFLGVPFDDELPGLRLRPTDLDTDPWALAAGALAGQLQAMLTLGVLLLVPLVALLLRLLFLRSQFLLVDHLVFSVHLHAFTLLVLTVAYTVVSFAIGDWLWVGAAVAAVIALSPAAYLVVALRRVYGRRGWARLWRFAVAGGSWLMATIAVLGLAVWQATELFDRTVASRNRFLASELYHHMARSRTEGDTAGARVLSGRSLEAYERTDTAGLVPHDHYHMAELLAFAGDTVGARAHLDRLLGSTPDDELGLGLAGLLARGQGDTDSAAALFARLLATGADSLPSGNVHRDALARYLAEARPPDGVP